MRRAWVGMIAIAACGGPATSPTRPAPVHEPSGPELAPAAKLDNAVVTGRVRANGKPVRYFGVVFTRSVPARLLSQPRAVRGPTGKFAVAHEPGRWDVIIVGPGFASTLFPDKELVRGKVIDLGDIDVQPGFTIQGDVKDPAGTPISGARVTLSQHPSYDGEQDELVGCYEGNLATETDVNGHYRFTGVSATALAGGQPQLRAMHDRHGASFPTTTRLKTTTVDLVVLPAGAIAGTIKTEVEEGRIVTASPTQQRGVFLIAFIDAHGRFRFDRIPAGDYEVSFEGQKHQVGVQADQDSAITFDRP